MPTFRITEGSLQERFQQSRALVQLFGGGFGNGKTANTVIKCLSIAKDYPGSNGLIARSTLPKLNDTIRNEFLKWCPPSWIKSFPRPSDKSSTCHLKNGTTINFRYIAQQGKSNESTTSNLLSATYDWAAIDQIEDPEITHKDFLDINGRMRGQARYVGDDPTMPRVGPGWLLLTTNPTRNWVYKKLVAPVHLFQRTGKRSEDLLIHPTTGEPMLDIFEGSTYENKDNLPPDFLARLEGMYRGQMRTRFLLGEWGGFEGLVYPQYNDMLSLLERSEVELHLQRTKDYYHPTIVEGFDYGIASPSCYLLGFVDQFGNTIIMDGFYETMLSPDAIVSRVKDLRMKWLGSANVPDMIHADPSIFRRTSGTQKTIGPSTAEMIRDNGRGLKITPGNNDILNGILKVQGYLAVRDNHKHPLLKTSPAPYLYFNRDLDFLLTEIQDYYWAKDSSGEPLDKPRDEKDHAMDALKYLMTKRPRIAGPIPVAVSHLVQHMRWHESDSNKSTRRARYG